MRIIQILDTLSYGDGVGLCVFSLDELLKKSGIETKIFAYDYPDSLNHVCETFDNKKIANDDIVLFHVGWYSELLKIFPKLPCKKWICYHNVTPSTFSPFYASDDAKTSIKTIKYILKLRKCCDHVFTVSKFNKKDLIAMGFTPNKISVCPIIVPFDDYKKPYSKEVFDKYNKEGTKILFVGRMAPHKKIEDLIKTFYYYKKFFDANAQLFLVGSFAYPQYQAQLDEFVSRLELEDVIFTGKIKFNEILSFYNMADIFLCMSEHEGLCLPLVEAMFFKLPVIAYNSSCIQETLGYNAELIYYKDFPEIARLINKLMTNEELRLTIIDNQNEQLKYFDGERLGKIWIDEILEHSADKSNESSDSTIVHNSYLENCVVTKLGYHKFMCKKIIKNAIKFLLFPIWLLRKWIISKKKKKYR